MSIKATLNRLNEIAKQQPLVGMITYTVLGFLRPAVYLFLVPFYTRHLSTEEFGLYDLMLVVSGFAMIVVGLRLSSGMLTFYYNYIDDRAKQKQYLSSTFTATMLISICILTIMFFIGPDVFRIIFKSDEVKFMPFGFTVFLYACMTEMGMIYYTFLKNEKDLVRYSSLIFIQVISVTIFQVLLISVFDMGVQGALLGMVFGWFFVLVAVLFFEKGLLTFNVNWDMVKATLKFSLPLIPYLLIYWLLVKGGRIFLEKYSTLEAVGLFAMIMTLSRLIILGIEAIVNGVRPFLFDQFALRDRGDLKQIGLLTNMIIIVPLITIPVIIFVGSHISWITGDVAYVAISPYMTLSCLVVFVFLYVKLFYQQLVFSKRSDLATILSFVALIFLVSGFMYWIPYYGIWGVLYATLLANIVLSVLFYVAGQKVLPVSYDYKTIFVYPILIFLIAFILEWWMIKSGFSYSAFGIVQLIILGLFIIVVNWNSVKDYKLVFMNRNK